MVENTQPGRKEGKKPPAEKKWKRSGFWIVLICFSSVWMFVFGVLVGRGTVPVQVDVEKLQNELITLKEAVLRKEKARVETYSQEIHDKAGLEFFEVLKQADGFRSPPPAPNKPATGSVPVPKLQPQKKPEPPAATAAGAIPNKLPVGTKPDDPPLNEKKAETEKKTCEIRWAVQVASMKDAAAADKMVETLRQKGYPAFRFGATVPGKGVWYRVRVGPFKDRTDADKKAIRLKNDNFSVMLVSP